MNQSPRKKGLGYYFRIEFSSLQGKITTGFLTLGLIAVILMLLTAYLLKPSINRYEYINEVIYPTHLQITLLQKNIETAINTSEKRHLNGLSKLNSEQLSQLFINIQQPLDSLKSLSAAWDSKEDIHSFQIAFNKSNSIIEELKAATASHDSALLVQVHQHTLPVLNKEVRTSLGNIIKNQAALRAQYNTLIKERNDSFLWILFGCFIAAFIIGSTIGSFIVMQVLRVIRQLKASILELSEGTLIAPIPPSKNELNSIGKAINTLTDNLRNISEFAVEVGKGNLDNNKLQFDNEGILTQSLFEMQKSLRKVAEEEKIRNWTSEGLASFNEYLRKNEDNLDLFASKLISKITKYLNINQGSIYILNKEKAEQPVLELKGCYAYDRQKFINKNIEPGQGLVGQVFLEKEYIYLENIPQNFMSITSGLGEATAKYLLIMPLKFNDEVTGIIELASLSELPEYKISFVEKLAESLSSAISQVYTSQTTARLLEEAQEMSEEMKAQEEMLRQNSEELMATQEKMEKEIAEIQEELSYAKAALSNTKEPHIIVSRNFEVIWLNKTAERFFNDSLHNLRNHPLKKILHLDSNCAIEDIAALLSQQGLNQTSTERVVIDQQAYEMQMSTFTAGSKDYYSICLSKQKIQA